MEKQLERIELDLQTNVRLACGELVKSISKELQPLQEHASKIRELENQKQRGLQPSCSLHEHASKIQDYEDLQKQHKLTLESCELLRSQNVRLQNQIKDLLAKRSAEDARMEVPVAFRSNDVSFWQTHSQGLSPDIQKMIQDHPELQSLMSSQTHNYKKLQKAHTVLLSKLKEHQQVIIQLRGQQISSGPVEKEAEEDRLAQLRSIIDSTGNSKNSLASSIHAMPDNPARSKPPSDGSEDHSNRVLARDAVNENNTIIINSSPAEPPTKSAESDRAIALTTAILPALIDLDVPTVPAVVWNESQPEFVSERPVKRRRLGNSTMDNRVMKLIKREAIAGQGIAEEGQASIDLDAVHTPIILPGRRSEEVKRRGFPVSDGRTNATQRHSEPPHIVSHTLSTNPASSAPVPDKEREVFVKNEPTVSTPVDVEDDTMSPPASVLSRWTAYMQGTPNRPVLQPKTPNTRITKPNNISAAHANLSPKKENIRPNGIEDSRIPAHPTSAIDLARKAFSPGMSLDKVTTPKSKHDPQAVSSTIKHQTPLQKKRNNQNTMLREKNISELSLNDFKINAAINQGFNQTFGGFNPNQETRRCLRDCSKPECCGGALAAAVRSAGINSLQDMSDTEKARLIRSYLGFPVSSLGDISGPAYQKLLGEAIGKQLAEKYGKQQQSRADSPPGYWRVDFPSTQERCADQKKADGIEKATIEARRREALRGDGLWCFRDE